MIQRRQNHLLQVSNTPFRHRKEPVRRQREDALQIEHRKRSFGRQIQTSLSTKDPAPSTSKNGLWSAGNFHKSEQRRLDHETRLRHPQKRVQRKGLWWPNWAGFGVLASRQHHPSHQLSSTPNIADVASQIPRVDARQIHPFPNVTLRPSKGFRHDLPMRRNIVAQTAACIDVDRRLVSPRRPANRVHTEELRVALQDQFELMQKLLGPLKSHWQRPVKADIDTLAVGRQIQPPSKARRFQTADQIPLVRIRPSYLRSLAKRDNSDTRRGGLDNQAH